MEPPPKDLLKAIAADLFKNETNNNNLKFDIVYSKAHPYSVIYKILFSGNRNRHYVYVKIPTLPEDRINETEQRLRNEFELLTTLQSVFSDDPSLSVIQPIGLYPQFNAIATIEETGPRLSDLITNKANIFRLLTAKKELLQYAALSGKWLMKFHSSQPNNKAPFEGQVLMNYCARNMEFIAEEKLDKFIGTDFGISNVLIKLESILSKANHLNTTISTRHGDFSGHNIIAGNNKLTVLDLFEADRESVEYDACNFWLSLEILKSDFRYSSATLSEMQEEFFKHYHLTSPNNVFFKAVKTRYLLNRIITISLRAKRRPRIFSPIFKHQTAFCVDLLTENFVQN